MHSLRGVWLVAVYTLFGCAGSEGDSDAASDDSAGAGAGGSSAGGSTGGAPTSGGAAGGGAVSGNGGASETLCAPGTAATDMCEVDGALCSGEDSCCRCVAFDDAICGTMWDCATPGGNPTECPDEAPTLGSACTLTLSCSYCAGNGPERFKCNALEPAWTEGAALACAG